MEGSRGCMTSISLSMWEIEQGVVVSSRRTDFSVFSRHANVVGGRVEGRRSRSCGSRVCSVHSQTGRRRKLENEVPLSSQNCNLTKL